MKNTDRLEQWLENYVRPPVKVRTYEQYRLIIEQYTKDKIGGMALDDLSPLVLQSFIPELLQSGNRREGKGSSANSANAVISVIQSSLKTAHLLGLTKEYTADKLKKTRGMLYHRRTKGNRASRFGQCRFRHNFCRFWHKC